MCPASLRSFTKSSRCTVSFGTVIPNCWQDALSCSIENVSTIIEGIIAFSMYSVLVTVLTTSFAFSLVIIFEIKFAPIVNCSSDPSERFHIPPVLYTSRKSMISLSDVSKNPPSNTIVFSVDDTYPSCCLSRPSRNVPNGHAMVVLRIFGFPSGVFK